MGVLHELVQGHVIDTRHWNGENPTFDEEYFVRVVAVIAVGTVWAFVWKLFYIIVHVASTMFFPRYKTLNKIQKVDWTSRVVAMVFIILAAWATIDVLGSDTNHRLVPVGTDNATFASSEWRLTTSVDDTTMYHLYLFYIMCFGYELYDLKNCWDIRMYSGVLHHLVLLIIFPTGWSGTTMSVPAMCMIAMTYLSNIPAHFRSFMVILGYRDSPLYKFNKWLWWVSYVIFRLFGIPWFSAQMFFTLSPMLLQLPLFPIAFYFPAMAIHYMLSLYWFVEMTKTMFPPDREMKRSGSFPIFPQDKDKAAQTIKGRPARGKAASSDSEDEGGQKFD